MWCPGQGLCGRLMVKSNGCNVKRAQGTLMIIYIFDEIKKKICKSQILQENKRTDLHGYLFYPKLSVSVSVSIDIVCIMLSIINKGGYVSLVIRTSLTSNLGLYSG